MKYLIRGILYDPIKCGDDEDWYFGEEEAECGDCGVTYGKQHTMGCDIERCPCCNGQLISCDCAAKYEVDENISETQLSKLIAEQKKENLYHDFFYSFFGIEITKDNFSKQFEKLSELCSNFDKENGKTSLKSLIYEVQPENMELVIDLKNKLSTLALKLLDEDFRKVFEKFEQMKKNNSEM